MSNKVPEVGELDPSRNRSNSGSSKISTGGRKRSFMNPFGRKIKKDSLKSPSAESFDMFKNEDKASFSFEPEGTQVGTVPSIDVEKMSRELDEAQSKIKLLEGENAKLALEKEELLEQLNILKRELDLQRKIAVTAIEKNAKTEKDSAIEKKKSIKTLEIFTAVNIILLLAHLLRAVKK